MTASDGAPAGDDRDAPDHPPGPPGPHDNQNQRTIGERGPAMLENYQYLEKMAHFDRERVPERVVHARGTTEQIRNWRRRQGSPDTASMVKLEVQLPKATPFLYISTKPIAGWTVKTTEAPLPEPVELYGNYIDQSRQHRHLDNY